MNEIKHSSGWFAYCHKLGFVLRFGGSVWPEAPFHFALHTNSRTGHTEVEQTALRFAHTGAHTPNQHLSAVPESSEESTNLDLQYTTQYSNPLPW